MICEVTITQEGLKQAVQDWLDKRVSEGHNSAAAIESIYIRGNAGNSNRAIYDSDKIVLTLTQGSIT